ncbi:DUF1285 domain-containing protein [Shewanella japonica]|uniref:DUF1285 domain-containing protein n=1 Tax=Shewanella japonica TaxID=93973 RepID=UPI000E76A415|nr:DUF1285 domain-containing protein [Shewanella japonica]
MADPINIAEQLGQLSPNNDESQQSSTPLCSDEPLFNINMQGEWTYLGSPLPKKFAKLFASVLNGIDGKYFLITPVEKVQVTVERHAFVIVDYIENDDNSLSLISSIGTEHIINNPSLVRLLEDAIEFPVERGVIAGLGRACYYRYINQFVTD